MHAPPAQIPQFVDLTDAAIRSDVIPLGRPAVLKGLVSAWPAVGHARVSAANLVKYLQTFDTGGPVDAVMTPPEVAGRIFYNDTMSGFNFIRNRLPLATVAEQVLRYAAFPNPPAVAVQSALIRDSVPGFAAENRLTFLDDSVLPRIWLGNAITTPAHFDEWNNIACVVSGRRRFTLFPPEQIENLYPGPVDFAPTGAPMSLVTVGSPDFTRYPRFRTALAAAVVAELGPGDAIYIPPTWWHHVESLDTFNLLVNYWWRGVIGDSRRTDSAFDCMMHCLLNLRQLPPETRQAWGAIFAHYVFGSDSSVTGHIPAERRGILGEISAEQAKVLRALLAKRLQS
jgi:hypothetical protein